MSTIDEKAGAAVRKLRQQTGVRQRDLAAAMEQDQPGLSRLESGKQRWSLAAFVLTARALGVTPAALLRRIAPK